MGFCPLTIDVGLGASDSEVVLIPLGVGLSQWLTARTVTECTRQLEAQSTLIGMQVYGPSGDGSPRLRVVGTVEGSRGKSCGRDIYVGSVGVGVGIGFPIEVHAGGSNTYVNGVFGPGPRKGCGTYGLSASSTCHSQSSGAV